jgi:hypothetical protein
MYFSYYETAFIYVKISQKAVIEDDSCLLRTACISGWVLQLDSTALVSLSTSYTINKRSF